MTLTEQVKIVDDKIKAHKAQYDLDRKAAKISALSSGELEKYEYLSGKDLGYKPDVIQKAKSEYSPLGKVFNKGLDESDKKGLLKRLKNIEGKNKDRQLEEISSYSATNKLHRIEFGNKNNQKARKLVDEIKRINTENKVCMFSFKWNTI